MFLEWMGGPARQQQRLLLGSYELMNHHRVWEILPVGTALTCLVVPEDYSSDID